MQSLQKLAAPDEVPASQLFAGALVKGQAASFALILDGGRCYTVLAVGGTGVRELELKLFDPTGARIEIEKRGEGTQLHHCPRWAGTYRVEARVKKGEGEIGVQAFVVPVTTIRASDPAPSSTSSSNSAAPAPQPPPQTTIVIPGDELATLIERDVATIAPGSHLVGEFLHGAAAARHGFTDWIVNLDAGRCYTIVGAGGPGVGSLYLFLWSPASRVRVAEARPRGAIARMSYCANAGGPHKLEAKTASGAGELRAGIYTR